MRGTLIRRLALWLGGALALYAVLGFLVLPPIVRSQLEARLGELLGRKVLVGQVRINPFALTVSIREFSLKEPDGTTTAIGFEDLTVNLTLSSLFRFGVIVEALDLSGLNVRVVRSTDNKYGFEDIVARLTSGPPAPPGPAQAGPAPRFAVYNIQIRNGRIDFDDRPGKTRHAVTDLHIGIPFISSLPAEIEVVVAPRLNAKVNGTPFEIVGETRPFKDRSVTTVRIDIDDLELAKYLEYVPLRVRVPSGKLTTRLVLSSAAVPGDRIHSLLLSGTLSLEGLKVRHADGAPLFALGRLSVDLSGLDFLQQRAIVTGLRIDTPEVDIVRRKDGSLDLLAALPRPAAQEPKKASERPFAFQVEQLALSSGRVRFVDRTPEKPVTLALNDLSLYVENLGNTGENNATVKMRARIGRAPLDVAGKLALLPRGVAFDLKASAREIELRPFSPYSAMYAGHGIDKGKLSLKHAWVVQDRKLTADNNVYLDQFTFGEKVDSPTATSLPVALAVSLLKDRNGIIDVNVPLSGSLDDPQIRIGEVIASAFRSPLEKAGSSPFALLGAQFGAGEELAYVEFAPGSAALDASGRAKLKTLATALAERPGLQLDISGRVDPKTDANPKSTQAQAEAELRKLADARAGAARVWLIETGKLPAQRVSIVDARTDTEGLKDAGKSMRVDFALR